ncbi:MAG: toll/interleukin-1 receptor domain-containing protein [Ktedonobacteraceae bacterium]
MANKAHLALLLQGGAAWNAWRETHPSVQPDLDFADLSDLDLSQVNLSGAHLSGARLTSVNLAAANLRRVHAEGIQLTQVNLSDVLLSDANLCYADFTDTDVSRATLTNTLLKGGTFRHVTMRETNLVGADLTLAHFYEADLSGANCSAALLDETNVRQALLDRVNFTSAFLAQADMTDATMAWTNLTNVDLPLVVGLETVQHHGPSSLGLDTVYRSRGMIPEAFLHGIGTTAALREVIRAVASDAGQERSCLLVSARADRLFAEQLQHDLQENGVACWLAPDEWGADDENRQHLDPCVHFYDKLLLILSQQSVKSEWVKPEIDKARLREGYEGGTYPTVLFPICLDRAFVASIPWWPRQKHDRETPRLVDFEHWQNPDEYQRALNQLLHDLTTSS